MNIKNQLVDRFLKKKRSDMQQSEYWYFLPAFNYCNFYSIYESQLNFFISDNLTVVTSEQFNPLNDNGKRPTQTNDDAESETNSNISIDKVLKYNFFF